MARCEKACCTNLNSASNIRTSELVLPSGSPICTFTDRQQAARVEATALQLFDQVANSWHLDPELYRPLLCWAAMLHETGLAINYTAIQRHSAYIPLKNSDLPGFDQEEQQLLAPLVRFHRKVNKEQEFCPKILNFADESIGAPFASCV